MQPANLSELIIEIEKCGFDKWLLLALTKAFTAARKGKLGTYDEHSFELHWMQNLVYLRDSILERTYEPSASVAFVIFDPMVREIFAAPFRDRIVHHFLYEMQAGWWDRRFIKNSYSCREGKGTLYGIKQAQRMMWRVTQNGTKKAYIVKLDIKGYFMHLQRQKLYDRVKWGLDRQFADVMSNEYGRKLYYLCDFLWQQVLFDDPIKKTWRRGPLANWNANILPPEKSLYCQPPEQGIVIGNLTSQLVSNIFLDLLDRFVTVELGYKWYGRYVDDFFIMVPKEDLARLKGDVVKIEVFLREKLGLVLHPKKRYCQSVYKGMSFLGARIYPCCLYPSDRLQKNFLVAAYDVTHGFREIESIVSYLGLMKHLNSQDFNFRVFEKVGWRYRM